MTTKTNIFWAGALLILCTCTLKNPNNIKRMEWLIGTWEHRTSKGNIYETWQKTDSDKLTAKSYMVKDKDTIVFETIRIVKEQSSLFYIPVVKDQNSGTPIRFEGNKISETQFIFENKTHDFPQIISYTKMGKDSLKAEISGLRNGKHERRYFPMRRIK